MTEEQESLLKEIEELNELITLKRSLKLNCAKERKRLAQLIVFLDGYGQEKEL